MKLQGWTLQHEKKGFLFAHFDEENNMNLEAHPQIWANREDFDKFVEENCVFNGKDYTVLLKSKGLTSGFTIKPVSVIVED